MSEKAIIIRPVGSRRFKYARRPSGSEVEWHDEPGTAFNWSDVDSAEEFKREHKSKFGFEDRVVIKRYFDTQHCRHCYSEQPTMRRNFVACESDKVTVEFQCSHCNVKEEAYYVFDHVNKVS